MPLWKSYVATMKPCKTNFCIFNKNKEKIGQLAKGTYIIDPQSLVDKIWDVLVPYDFMPLSLITLDRKTDPHKHTNPVNTLLEIIGATDSFKCKLLFETLKEVTLR